MTVRNPHNWRITFVEDSIGGRSSNEVDEFSSLGNTTVNQEAETEGIRPPNPGSDAPFIRINLPDIMANP